MDQTFPKSCRLLKRKEFRLVYETGTPYRNAGFHLFIREQDRPGPARIGLTATRAMGNAVKRNRVRRLARDDFRRMRGEIKPGYDMVLNFHRRMPNVERSEFSRLFVDILRKARLLESA